MDRIIPDCMRALRDGQPIKLRNPSATRPWQHVLESLSGYLCLGRKLIEGKKEFAEAWNFGPDDSDNCTVEEVLSKLKVEWPSVNWRVTDRPQPKETCLLQIDSMKARQKLAWKPVWSFDEGLGATAEWYNANLEQKAVISLGQLESYTAAARNSDLEWSGE